MINLHYQKGLTSGYHQLWLTLPYSLGGPTSFTLIHLVLTVRICWALPSNHLNGLRSSPWQHVRRKWSQFGKTKELFFFLLSIQAFLRTKNWHNYASWSHIKRLPHRKLSHLNWSPYILHIQKGKTTTLWISFSQFRDYLLRGGPPLLSK